MTTRQNVDGGAEGDPISTRDALELYGTHVIADWDHAEVLYAVEYEDPDGGEPLSRSVQRIGPVYWHVYEGDGREHVPYATFEDVLRLHKVDLFGIRRTDLAVTCTFEPVDDLVTRLFWADPGSPRVDDPFRLVINGEPWRCHEDENGSHFQPDDDPDAVRQARSDSFRHRMRAAVMARRTARERMDAAEQASRQAPGEVSDTRAFHTALSGSLEGLRDDEACGRVGAHALERERTQDTLVFRVTTSSGHVTCAVYRIGPFHWHWSGRDDAPDAFESVEALFDARGDELFTIGADTKDVDAPGLPSPVLARLLVWRGAAPSDTRTIAINGEEWSWAPGEARAVRAPGGVHTHDVTRRRVRLELEAAATELRDAEDTLARVRAELADFNREDARRE